MSITVITSTYPFAVFTDSKHSAFWVMNQKTGERVSKKNLSEKEAYRLAQEKALELDLASRGN